MKNKIFIIFFLLIIVVISYYTIQIFRYDLIPYTDRSGPTLFIIKYDKLTGKQCVMNMHFVIDEEDVKRLSGMDIVVHCKRL